MIGFMPELYPDELLYSLMARYANRSGYLLYQAVADELFVNPKVNPDMLFLNHYKDEVLDVLTKNKTMNDLVEHHTMFNNYGLFSPSERRKDAYDSFIHMKGNYRQKLPKTLSGNKKVLKYCPICAKRDREKYLETYWHRSWQIEDIAVCPIHRCYLESTDVSYDSKASATLVSAEEVIPADIEPHMCENQLQIQLASYMYEVFNQDIDLDNTVLIGKFLHSQLEGTKYVSQRGQKRNITLLHNDFTSYYSSLPYQGFNEIYHLQNLFTNQQMKFIGVCMVGMFLNITPYNLVHMVLPKSCKASAIKKHSHRTNNSRYKALLHWKKLDNQTLPLVKDSIAELWEDTENNNRPQKINIGVVATKLNISAKKLNKMPNCLHEIKKYQESYPEYWARKVAWAVTIIQQNGYTLSYTRIKTLLNINRQNYEDCKPFLDSYFDDEKLLNELKHM